MHPLVFPHSKSGYLGLHPPMKIGLHPSDFNLMETSHEGEQIPIR
jgi:hypothetical protein